MRIRTLFLLTSLTAVFGCPSDDDETTSTTVGESSSASTSMSTTDVGSESSTASTSASTTDTTTNSTTVTTDATESSGGSESSGPADSSSGGGSSESGGSSVTCESYCAAYEENCAEDGDQYADHQACLDACNAWDAGEPGATSGNTQECHLYHAGAAGDNPGLHCPHAQENAVKGGCVD